MREFTSRIERKRVRFLHVSNACKESEGNSFTHTFAVFTACVAFRSLCLICLYDNFPTLYCMFLQTVFSIQIDFLMSSHKINLTSKSC